MLRASGSPEQPAPDRGIAPRSPEPAASDDVAGSTRFGGPDDLEPNGILEWIARAAWWVGLVLIGLVAIASVVVTLRVVRYSIGGGLDRAGFLTMGLTAVLIAAGFGALVAVVFVARRGNRTLAASIGIATLVITRAVAIATIPTPLKTDWADYHNRAVILAQGGAFDSARPPGWPYVLSLLYRVAGPNPLAGEIFALACAVVIGLLIYVLARRFLGDVAAAAGLYLWAISPGPAAFTAVLASEHLHNLAFIATFALALVALRRRWIAWLGVGALLGLSQYVRPIGLVLLPAFAALPFLVGLPGRRAALAAVSLAVAFVLVLVPSVAWQYERYGRLTLSTSNFDGWNLLVGLNVKSGGRYSRDDMALVNADPNTLEFRDRSYQLAIERLTQHPANVAILAVPKFATMWGDSTYGATWTLGTNSRGHPRVAAALGILSQVGYAVTAVLAAAWLWIRRNQRDALGLLTVLCLEAVALSATVLEVQPRYHAFFEPVLCLLAGASVAWLAQRVRRSEVSPAPLGTAGPGAGAATANTAAMSAARPPRAPHQGGDEVGSATERSRLCFSVSWCALTRSGW